MHTKIPVFRKTLLKFATGKVLETGVGTSRNLKHYPDGLHVTGVDWSSNILEVALRKFTHSITFEYKLDDVENLNFDNDSFDTVVDTFGLEYYLNPARALSEIKRVCKKDGLILIMTSGRSQYDLLNLLIEFKTPYYVTKNGYFPNREWDSLIKESDFEVIKSERKMNGTIYIYILRNSKKWIK